MVLSKTDYILCEYTLTYLSSLARVLSKLKLQEQSMATAAEHQ